MADNFDPFAEGLATPLSPAQAQSLSMAPKDAFDPFKEGLAVPIGQTNMASQVQSQPAAPTESPDTYTRQFARNIAAVGTGIAGFGPDAVNTLVANPAMQVMGYKPFPSITRSLRDTIDQSTKGTAIDTNVPNDSISRVLDSAGTMIGGGIATAGLGALVAPAVEGLGLAKTAQGIRNLTGLTPAGYKAQVGASLGAAGAHELAPDSSIAPIAGAVVGGMIPGAIGGAVNMIGKPSPVTSTLIKKASDLANPILDKDINYQAIQDARELGIQLPASAQINNDFIQSLENFGQSTKGVGGRYYKDLFDKINDTSLANYKDVLNQVHPEEIADPLSVGASLKGALDRQTKYIKGITNAQYSAAMFNLPDDAAIAPKSSLQFIDSVLDRLSKSPIQSTDRQGVINTFNEIKNAWGDAAEVPIDNLLETKKVLNEISDWDVTSTGVKNYYRGLLGQVKHDLETYGSSDPEFMSAFNTAEETHKMGAEALRNDFIKSVIKNESPTTILNQIRTPEDVSRVEKALALGDNATNIFAEIKRAKLQQILDAKVMNDGDLSFAKFVTQLDSVKNNKVTTMVRALVGDDQYNKLQQLRNVLGSVQEGMAKFANTSKTASNLQTTGLAGLILSGVTDLATLNVKPGLSKLLAGSSSTLISKALTNPAVMNDLLKTARAASQGNVNAYMVNQNALMRSLRNAGLGYVLGDSLSPVPVQTSSIPPMPTQNPYASYVLQQLKAQQK